MQYTRLGDSGLQVSRLSLGMMTYGDPNWREWILPEDEARPFVKKALESGINFFDTADMYSRGVSEQVTGKLLAEFADEMGVKPAQLALAWLLHKPAVAAPVIGASKLHHLDDAVAAVEIDLTDDVIARLEEPYTPQWVSGHE